jgi:uncharacterized protein YecE (DUF72 family)
MSAAGAKSPDAIQPRIGTAGWSIPRQHAAEFPPSGSHLARYARRLNAVEINSSFYRPHRRATYERWAASVPADFAFAVKAPRAITHDLRLADADATLDRFLAEATGLGEKLGMLLFQFPPRFAFDARTAGAFLAALRARHDGDVAFEPRHATWFTPHAEDLLVEHRIARVAADPAVVPAAAAPSGWPALWYFRLHGSPRVYWSDYGAAQLDGYAKKMRDAAAQSRAAWCIFDNTAAGAATGNALALAALIR